MTLTSRLRFSGAVFTPTEISEIFNPVIRTEYASPDVYKAPVDQQAVMLRAIESLRLETVPKVGEVEALADG